MKREIRYAGYSLVLPALLVGSLLYAEEEDWDMLVASKKRR